MINLYETDYCGWLFSQRDKIERGEVNTIDRAHLIEELGDLGRREQRAVQSQLTRLLVHLLKWRYQPNQRSGSWRATIREARKQIHRLISESPSLQPNVNYWLGIAYDDARELASDETGLPLDEFPEELPFTDRQILDPDFLPDNRPPHAEQQE